MPSSMVAHCCTLTFCAVNATSTLNLTSNKRIKTMRKILTTLLLGVFLSIPATALATCASFYVVRDGSRVTRCYLVDQFVDNGVEFCGYSC